MRGVQFLCPATHPLALRPGSSPSLPACLPAPLQEYTLVAIVAVAAHLSQHPMGDRFGLPLLARRYRQDTDALEQVGGRAWGLCSVGWVHLCREA